MALVDLVLEDPRWLEAGLGAVAEDAARAALAACGRAAEAHEISLLACDDARIGGLNSAFRGRDAPTNVLAWPHFSGDVPEPGPKPGGEPLFLGDLALAYDTCAREAAVGGMELGEHAAHLVVHGVLHLLGHDHANDGEAARMEALEAKILATMGIANPYTR